MSIFLMQFVPFRTPATVVELNVEPMHDSRDVSPSATLSGEDYNGHQVSLYKATLKTN